MKDVARILAAHCRNVDKLLADLAASPSAQSNLFFAEMVRRIGVAAGIKRGGMLPSEPKELLALMEDDDGR